MTKKITKTNDTVIYQTKSGAIELRGDLRKETVWATQAQIAELFNVKRPAVTKHLQNIYKDGELKEKSVCSILEHTANDGKLYKTTFYNLDAIISIGYRVNSKKATEFRIWATKTLHSHIVEGYTINPTRISSNYDAFMEAVSTVKSLLPPETIIGNDEVIELVRLFADTWISLDAYDKESLDIKKPTKKKVALTTAKLQKHINILKQELMEKETATELFAIERERDGLEGIVGNVMQSFNGNDMYPSVEAKAAHLLYFIIKNHPFIDGNKRTGAYSFIWFLNMTKILDTKRMTPEALTAITLLIAESNPNDKEKMTKLVMMLISKK
jgi:prophage maintenance system killer protein